MDTHLVDNYVWSEKYRPSTIEECILPKHIKDMFLGFISSKNFPHLMLSGGAGTGKTTSAKALCNQLGYEYILINGSDQRNIDTVRTTIRDFASSMSMYGKPKCIIIDESDGFSNIAQAALRATMEEFHFVKFILTCNYKNKLIEPIHSRTTCIDFTSSKQDRSGLLLEFVKRVFSILKQENVTFDKGVVVEIVKKFYPDNRRILNELQRLSSVGSIDTDALTLLSNTNIDSLISSLKKRELTGARQWIVDNVNMDIEIFYTDFYNAMYTECTADDIPQAILVISKYMYQGSFVVDQEINLMAMMVELMQTVGFK